MDTRDMMDTSALTPRKWFRSNVRWLLLGLALGILGSALWTHYYYAEQTAVSAVSSRQPVESYQVVSHENASGEWVIIATREARRVQITAVCDFYKWGGRQPVKGATSCDLLVGRTLVPNRLGTRPGDFVDVWQMGDTLFITQGKGQDRVHQQFTVRSAKVLQ